MSSRRAIRGDATTWKMESSVFRDLPCKLDGLATARAGSWRTSLSTTRAEGYYSWAEAEWIARGWSTYPAPISPYSMLRTRRGGDRGRSTQSMAHRCPNRARGRQIQGAVSPDDTRRMASRLSRDLHRARPGYSLIQAPPNCLRVKLRRT